eukprot:s2988_g2.t1
MANSAAAGLGGGGRLTPPAGREIEALQASRMEEHKLFVGSLPPDITKEEIEMVFKTYGEVADVHVISGDRNRSNSGQACAFVMYKAREYGDAAIQVTFGAI